MKENNKKSTNLTQLMLMLWNIVGYLFCFCFSRLWILAGIWGEAEGGSGGVRYASHALHITPGGHGDGGRDSPHKPFLSSPARLKVTRKNIASPFPLFLSFISFTFRVLRNGPYSSFYLSGVWMEKKALKNGLKSHGRWILTSSKEDGSS